MGNLSKDDLKEVAEVFVGIVEAAVTKSLENHSNNFYVEPESHYQDHLVIQDCRNNFKERTANHVLISGLNQDNALEKAVVFSSKLEKREGLIIKTATRVGVTAIVGGILLNIKDIFFLVISIIKPTP